MSSYISTSAYPPLHRTDLSSLGPGWDIEWDGAAVLVHDMQEYFVRALPSEVRTPLCSNVAKVVRMARERDAPIIYSGQPGRMTPEQRGLLLDFWGPGMTSSPEDRELVTQALARESDLRITKWRYSAYSRTILSEYLETRRRNQLIVCGIYTHVGIVATAIDAMSRDVKVFVVADATADFSWRHQLGALDYIGGRCGQIVFAEDGLR